METLYNEVQSGTEVIDPVSALFELGQVQERIIREAYPGFLEGLAESDESISCPLLMIDDVERGETIFRIYWFNNPDAEYPAQYSFIWADPRFGDIVNLEVDARGNCVGGERFGNLHTKNAYTHTLTNPATLRKSARKIIDFLDSYVTDAAEGDPI